MAIQKKIDEKYLAFLRDIGKAMENHGVTDLVCICGFGKDLRNTYLPLAEENHLYCSISDVVDAWLTQSVKN